MNRTVIVVSLFVVSMFMPLNVVSTTQVPNAPKQTDDSPICIRNVTMSTGRLYNELVMFIDISYNYSFYGDERIIEQKCYLSLDNYTFLLAAHDSYDEGMLYANGTGSFRFKPPQSPTLPFDVQEGQILYGYVEVDTSNNSTYRTRIFSKEIIMTVIRPYFGLDSRLVLLICVIAAIPIVVCCIHKIQTH
ncbi:MAG: hypothetical protein RTU30_16445 [Candidatus Thorarchaeota archaeon]